MLRKDEFNWQELRDQLVNMLSCSTEETREDVVVDMINHCIEVKPVETNRNTIYHLEEVVDFCRYWGLSCWASVWEGRIYIHIY